MKVIAEGYNSFDSKTKPIGTVKPADLHLLGTHGRLAVSTLGWRAPVSPYHPRS